MSESFELRFRVTVRDDLPNGLTAALAVDSLGSAMRSGAVRWHMQHQSWISGPVVELEPIRLPIEDDKDEA